MLGCASEGAEWFALRGATAVLARWRPTMLMEINRLACNGLRYEPERIWESLKPYGYLMWAVGPSPAMCRSLSTPGRLSGLAPCRARDSRRARCTRSARP